MDAATSAAMETQLHSAFARVDAANVTAARTKLIAMAFIKSPPRSYRPTIGTSTEADRQRANAREGGAREASVGRDDRLRMDQRRPAIARDQPQPVAGAGDGDVQGALRLGSPGIRLGSRVGDDH